MTKTINSKSKFLSLILRHKPEVIGVEMDKNGWVKCSDIKNKTFNTRNAITQKDLELLVETDDKNRYSFNNHKTKIRANQGHSVDVDLEFDEAEPPKTLYHGTKHHTFNNHISKDGLKPMQRKHVHLSDDIFTALDVGKRRQGNVIVLYVDSEKMYNDGVKFYKSVNGVWLTNRVEPKYIKQLVS